MCLHEPRENNLYVPQDSAMKLIKASISSHSAFVWSVDMLLVLGSVVMMGLKAVKI